MKIFKKENAKYLLFLIILSLPWLLGKEFLFNQARGSTGTITATVTVNPLLVKVKAVPKTAIVEKDFQVSAEIKNLGESILNDVTASIYLPPGLILLSDQNQYLGEIESDRKKVASWKARGQEAGAYVMISSVSAINASSGESITHEASAMVAIKDKLGTGRTSFFASFLRIFTLQ